MKPYGSGILAAVVHAVGALRPMDWGDRARRFFHSHCRAGCASVHPMKNTPLFSNFRKTKSVVTPQGELLNLKKCERCDLEFLGTKLQAKCSTCRITGRKKPNK